MDTPKVRRVFSTLPTLPFSLFTLAILALTGVLASSVEHKPAFGSSIWQQIGDDIDGSAAADWFGTSVAISGDGTTIAVSGAAAGSVANGPGEVRVYRTSAGAWTQLGSALAEDPTFGTSLALNDDGTILAIGEPGADYVAVYRYGADWTVAAADQLSGSSGSEYGYAVDLSSDGSRLAIGGPGGRGLVQVFENSGTNWAQVGGDITGLNDSRTGAAVALSGDGLTLAFGGPGVSGGACGDASPHESYVNVFTYRDDLDIWSGHSFTAEAADDCLGTSVALNTDGTVLAAGAPLNDGNGSNAGHVMAWFKGSDNRWVRRGSDIDGSSGGVRLGTSVSLDSTGDVLLAGAPYGNYAEVFQFDSSSSSWGADGGPISGENRNEFFGYSVAVSSTGSRFVVGGPGNDDVDFNAGHARVFGTPSTADAPGSNNSAAELGNPGIFLTVMGGLGIKASTVTIEYGSDRIRANSPYSLELIDLATQDKRVLASGFTESGSFAATVSLGDVAEGSYRLRLWAYSSSGQILRLGNTLVVRNGVMSALTPEELQPSVY